MENFPFIEILIVFAVYLAINYFYLNKKLGIKIKRRGLLSMHRNRYFLAIDFLFIFLFLGVIMGYANGDFTFMESHSYIFAMFGLFIMLSINSGIEEWLLHRKDKAFYHEWLNSLLYLMILFVLITGGN